MRKKKKKVKESIGSFLQSLDLSALGLSPKFIKVADQVDRTFEVLGTIKQRLLENGHYREVRHFDKVLEREFIKLPKEKTLFPNNIAESGFGISSVVSDPYANMIGQGSNFFSQCYNNGKVVSIQVGSKKAILGHESVDPDLFMGSLNEFVAVFEKFRKPTIIQHWCCLWNWACENQSFFFPFVPIKEILGTVYKSLANGDFPSNAKKAFSESLNFFHNSTVRVPVDIQVITTSGVKKIDHVERNFRLLNLDLAQRSKENGNYLKIAGKLLPDLNPGKYRGRFFPKGIFALDGNKDGNRILLAYRLCNRFDQMRHKPIHWSVRELIISAGLEKSYASHKSNGCRKLTKSLRRLVKVKCIGDFEPGKISARLTKPVVVYPVQ